MAITFFIVIFRFSCSLIVQIWKQAQPTYSEKYYYLNKPCSRAACKLLSDKLFHLSAVLQNLNTNCAVCKSWEITNFEFRVKLESFGTMFPECSPKETLVEASTVLWIDVKPCGFPFAKVLVF